MLSKVRNFFYDRSSSENLDASQTLNVSKLILACALAIGATTLLYSLTLLFFTWPIEELSLAKSGTFGDSFGALNSLFTGLGFAGLLVTIFLQREDLRLTRLELSDTKAEIKLQSQTFLKQQFEDSFHRILSLYKENLLSLVVKQTDTHARFSGIEALSHFCTQLDRSTPKKNSTHFPTEKLDQDEFIYNLYQTCQRVMIKKTRYIETFNAALQLIHEDCFSENKKNHYHQILISQLTVYEMKYLFYQAFLSRENYLLRHAIVKSKSFQNRFRMIGIPNSHWRSFESLWNISPQKFKLEAQSMMTHERFKSAKERIARRQKKPN